MFQYLEGTVIFSWTIAPLLVSLGSFTTFVLARLGTFDAQTAFVSLTLLNSLRGPLILLPLGIVSLIQGLVAVRRINRWQFRTGDYCQTQLFFSNANNLCRRISGIIIIYVHVSLQIPGLSRVGSWLRQLQKQLSLSNSAKARLILMVSFYDISYQYVL